MGLKRRCDAMRYASRHKCIDEPGVFYSHALGLSPLVIDRHLEQVTSRVCLGAALVGGGVLCLIFNH